MAVYTETLQLEDKVSQTARAAKAALLDFEAGLEQANKELVKSAALGDQVSYDKALAKASKYSESLAKLHAIPGLQAEPNAQLPNQPPTPNQPNNQPPKPTVANATRDIWADAAHAAQVGKEVIGAAIEGIKSAFASLAQGDVKGAIQGLTDGIAGAAKSLDLLVPGLGQAVSMIISIAGGLVAVTAGLIQKGMAFAIESAQAKQQMLSMFDAMGAGQVQGAELDEMLSGLADRFGITKDAMVPLTKAFLQMGIKGKEELEKLTVAALSAQAIVGSPAGAEAFTQLQKKIALAAETGQKFKLGTKQLLQLSEAGVNVSDVAAQMGMKTEDLASALNAGTVDAKKFGDALTEAVTKKGEGPLKRLGSTVDNIKNKFIQDIGDMFEDIDVGPFMDAVKDLFSIFSASSASGETLKTGIQAFFKETFEIATKLVPIVKHFLLDLVIYGLKAYIALKPTIEKLKELWNSAVQSGYLLDALKAIGIAVAVVAAVIVVLVGIVGALIATVMVASAIFGAFIGTLIYLGVVIAETVVGWVQTGAQAAMDFVMGIVNGITNGYGMVVDAVKNLAGGAIDTFKNVLGIASPSKVMMELGEGGIGEGLVGGIGAASNDVHGAASDLASASVEGATNGQQSPSSSSGGTSGNVSIVINIDGAGKSAQEITDEMVEAAWERYALASGL